MTSQASAPPRAPCTGWPSRPPPAKIRFIYIIQVGQHDAIRNRKKKTCSDICPRTCSISSRPSQPDTVQAAAAHDLAADGRYTDSYLILTDDRLGQFHHVDGHWTSEWRPLEGSDRRRDRRGARHGRAAAYRPRPLLPRQSPTAGQGGQGRRRVPLHASATPRRSPSSSANSNAASATRTRPTCPPKRASRDEKKIRCDKCGHVIPPWSEICPKCVSKRKVLSRLTGLRQALQVAAPSRASSWRCW